jgi:hypothetical protein
MENSNSHTGINKRSFVSCGMFISCLGLPFSGLMNHLFVNSAFTIQKHVWMSVHSVLAVLFIFFAAFHISYNWKSLVKYLESYSVRIFSKELVLASVLIFMLLFAAVFQSIEA